MVYSCSMSNEYKQHRIQLGHCETDVDLVLPNGQVISLQYRLEAPSIDVCLPEDLAVTNWTGDDMEPAPEAGPLSAGFAHVRLAKQLVIDLNPESVDV